MEISALGAPSEGLLPMEREVGGAAPHLLDCKIGQSDPSADCVTSVSL